MLYKKVIKTQKATIKANTIGDLSRNFNIELHEYLMELLDKFPVNDEYGVIYDTYYTIESEYNHVDVFHGRADVLESPDYTVMLDLMHSRIYYIGQSKVNNSIHEYTIDGRLLDQKEYGLKNIDIDEFIQTHLIDYHCKNIGELLDTFKLDVKLSEKLRQHRIDEDIADVYYEYLIQEYEDTEYYVFPSSFSLVMATDVDAPIYYIDPKNQLLYKQEGGMLGITVTVYNFEDKEIKTISPDCIHGEFNIRKILESDKILKE